MAGQDAPTKCTEALSQTTAASSPWLEAIDQRQNQTGHAAEIKNQHIDFQPPEKIDGTFTSGEHKVSSGVYVAKGDAKVTAEGNATVYGFDQASIKGKDKTTLYLSDKTTGQMDGEGVIFARQNSHAYGFDNSLVYAFDRTEVHAHDAPMILAFDKTEIYANDNSTTCAFDNAFVWPRSPLPPDMDRVLAIDHAVLATDTRKVDDKALPLPRISLFNDATWIEYEPQFHNPVLHRDGNTP